MEFVYIGIGVVIGVVAILWLDVGGFSKKFEKEEEEFDAKDEHNEGKQ